MRTRRLAVLLLATLVAALAVTATASAARQACGAPCGIVKSNLLIGWKTAKSYAGTHGGRLPTGRAFVTGVLDVTAGLDPGVGGIVRAKRLDDPAAVLIDPRSTPTRIILWGRAANGVVVSLTGGSRGGPTFHVGG